MLVKHSGFKLFSRKKLCAIGLSFVLILVSLAVAVGKNMTSKESYAATSYIITLYDMMDNTTIGTWTCSPVQNGICNIINELSLNYFLRHEGYSLTRIGSSDSQNDFYPETEYWLFYGDTTLYFYYSPASKFTLSFDGNGGSNKPANMWCYAYRLPRYGKECDVVIPDNIPVYSGRTFQGYGLTPNAAVAAHQPGDTVTLGSDKTLYALWLPMTYKLTLDFGNGSPAYYTCDIFTLGNSCQITIPNTIPAFGQRTFYDYANGNEHYQPGDTVTMTGNKTIYARWLPTYTLYYDLRYDNLGNQVMGSCQPDTPDDDDSCYVQIMEDPSRDGYNFLGWSRDTGGANTVEYYSSDEIELYDNYTIYAVWKKIIVVDDETGDEVDNEAKYMQDISIWGVTLDAGDSVVATDKRDGKKYWITRLENGAIWMTQNLDLDLDPDTVLSSLNTDLVDGSLSGAYGEGYEVINDVIYWVPATRTLSYEDGPAPKGTDATRGDLSWENDRSMAYSMDVGEYYMSSIPSDFGDSYCSEWHPGDSWCSNNFAPDAYDENGEHGHVGNYYNFAAAVASNYTGLNNGVDTRSVNRTSNDNPADFQNSICPAGWRLPVINLNGENSDDIYDLVDIYNDGAFDTDEGLLGEPLYMLETGVLRYGTVNDISSFGGYWATSSVYYSEALIGLSPYGVEIWSDGSGNGFPIRCVARGEIPYYGTGDYEWKDEIDEYVLKSDEGITLLIDLSLNALRKISVDGEDLSEDDYSLDEDGAAITLSTTYLNSLSAGRHVFAAEYDNGYVVDLPFVVLAGESDDSELPVPDTGKNTKEKSGAVVASLAVLGIGVVSLFSIVYIIKSKQRVDFKK